MKAAVGFGLLLMCWLTVAAPATTSRLERTWLFGNEYVRLDKWAASSGLRFDPGPRNREPKISGGGVTLRFEADSSRVTVNGILVHLSSPIAIRNGVAYIPPVDIASTLEPLVSPGGQQKKVIHICLDPGHGGTDPGFLTGREKEKKYTLLLAKEVGEQLSKAGYKVSYTRTGDSFIKLPSRPEYASKRGADLFVSLHFNSEGKGGESVKGVEVYCMSPARTSSTNARGEGAESGLYTNNRFDGKNILLAYQVQKSLVTRLGLEDRGVRRARYAVLRDAEMPAILVESGYLSNRAESQHIFDPAYRRQLARAIVDGIQDYKQLVVRE
jgi:N-acetylmuramoyl-L-alanine amidase